MTVTNSDQATSDRFPRELVRRLLDNYRGKTLDHAAGSMTEPATVFTDPVRFQKELDVLFRGGAHIIGWTGELPKPGTFITKMLPAIQYSLLVPMMVCCVYFAMRAPIAVLR